MKQLSSGARTGDLCRCGAPIWAYHRTRWYKPGEVIPAPEDDTTWHWELVCGRGHKQLEPKDAPVQLSLMEML